MRSSPTVEYSGVTAEAIGRLGVSFGNRHCTGFSVRRKEVDRWRSALQVLPLLMANPCRSSSRVTAMMRRRPSLSMIRRRARGALRSLSMIPTRRKAHSRTGWRTDIPADTHALRATAGKPLKNDFGRSGYGGPCPPPGHGPHRYYFTVYAVDVPALDVAGRSREDLETALEGHTLAKAQFMGRYERAR